MAAGRLAHTGGVATLALAMLGASASAESPPANLTAANDLARDGSLALQRGVPVVILFSLPGCPYCEVVRHHYLMPLMREGAANQRPLVREADLASTAALRGFDGESGSGSALAKRYGVRVAPSVLVLDGRGRQLAPILEGGDVAGMYGAYLDDTLGAAHRALKEDR